MTPLEAQEIYHAARMAAYQRCADSYTPVNQHETIMAGFQAVIDAVTREIDNEYAMKVLLQSDFTGGKSLFAKRIVNVTNSPQPAATVPTAEQVENKNGDNNG